MSFEASSFSFPTAIELGAGRIQSLGACLSRLGVRRPLVVTDAGFAGTDSFERVRQALGELDGFGLFTEVHSNPLEADVRGGYAAYQEQGCDGVVGVGGGSPLDVAKAIRLLIKDPSLDLAAFNYEDDWSGLVPFVAVPTTAGTGSEVGRSAVITPKATGRKAVLFHPALLASVAILDPELTRSLPAKLTAATGVDALTHCIESYTSPVYHPLCDGIALEGIRITGRALPRAVAEPTDLEARGEMLVAAAMGGIAFQKDLGAAHSMAHPLSNLHGMHHGLANALCLPWVMAFNAERQPGCYRAVAQALGQAVDQADDAAADQAAIHAVRSLLDAVGITLGLAGQGLGPADLPPLVAEALVDPCHRTNPVPVGESDFLELYRAAL